LIAIIITLRPHQDKPLPQWPYNISVNSLISIYVVILKGAVLLVTAEGLGTYILARAKTKMKQAPISSHQFLRKCARRRVGSAFVLAEANFDSWLLPSELRRKSCCVVGPGSGLGLLLAAASLSLISLALLP